MDGFYQELLNQRTKELELIERHLMPGRLTRHNIVTSIIKSISKRPDTSSTVEASTIYTIAKWLDMFSKSHKVRSIAELAREISKRSGINANTIAGALIRLPFKLPVAPRKYTVVQEEIKSTTLPHVVITPLEVTTENLFQYIEALRTFANKHDLHFAIALTTKWK